MDVGGVGCRGGEVVYFSYLACVGSSVSVFVGVSWGSRGGARQQGGETLWAGQRSLALI